MISPAEVGGAVARSHAASSWNRGFGSVRSQYAVGHARLLRMKEDVLEQMVDDYLQLQGYFTPQKGRFNPPKDQDYVTRDESVPSDIDVVGLHPLRTGADRVIVVSCESWQSGLDAAR